ncbi:hypothetical protein [Sulfurimonas marina]|uniref:Uncharacterized protein n=1 Tax=Sulfurimonas marina TaxID=2590551 RepID=A0A7M1AWA9_9BACT|nr:hypothetical protein [Sulfurimonas marina]QOP41704.1 hypothetical protein FJR03_08130 [Sulfurimonas marina]
MIDFKTNPFDSGHIKNYILLYVSIVVIMVLFFIASELFIEETTIEKKVFDYNQSATQSETLTDQQEETKEEFKPKFKLLEKAF